MHFVASKWMANTDAATSWPSSNFFSHIPSSKQEVPGLIPGTGLGPADVLTSALATPAQPLTSRSAPRAPSGPAPTTHEATLAHSGPHFPFLFRQTISHTPIVWSACGRPHRDTLTVLRSLIKSIARKRNFVSAEVVHQKLHASFTLEIWTHSAQQIRACWPLSALPDPLEPHS